MDNYIVSARKYRPVTFESVVGQSSLTTTLKNAIKSGKLAHAYLFCGPRGVGKTTCARIFAKTINCLNPKPNGEACNECESCKAFNESRSFNIHELDAASNNGVDQIKDLIDQVRIPPQVGQYKVFIIDEVHMLSTQAFNAFLKTLEEPPKHVIFILATTEKHKILPTILSRCQIYDFNRMGVEDMVAHLAYVASKEGITAEPAALNIIAQKADGGMRDALSIFDQIASSTNGNITYQGVVENLNVLDYDYYFKLTDLFLKNDVNNCLLTFNEILNKGFEASHFITGLASHFRDLLVSHDEATISLLQVGAEIKDKYRSQAKQCTPKFLYRAMKLCNDCDLNYKASKNKRLLVELTLIQVAQITSGEEDEISHGRSPKQLIKPLFTKQAASQTSSSNVVVAKNAETGETLKREKPSTVASTASVQSAATASSQSETNPSLSTADAIISRFEKSSKNEPHKVKSISEIPSFSISSMGNSFASQKQATVKAEEQEIHINLAARQPLTQEELINLWIQYRNTLPHEQTALIMRMKSIRPVAEGDTCKISVDNKMIGEDINSIKKQFIRFMQERLNNPDIKVEIIVREQPTHIMTRAEKFEAMTKKNPQLLVLKKKFNLRLY